MSKIIDYEAIIKEGWYNYNPKREISSIQDMSANVSTNKVFRVNFKDYTFVMVKLSSFGRFENFKEDHNIINVMANNLEYPYDLFLSSSLMKNKELYLHRHEDATVDMWMVFYRVVRIKNKLPKRLNDDQIKIIGRELALFHKACDEMTPVLPSFSKTIKLDVYHLLRRLEKPTAKEKFQGYSELIKEHCNVFLENIEKYKYDSFNRIPVFVDWNIGNFSVRDDISFFSRWDYDWFRMGSRVLDFYFFSRVCSDIGDRTDFSYTVTQLNEERFILFLKEYHKIFPLTRNEVFFIKEAYRFFILNYVISNGTFFFNDAYAKKLQTEAYEKYLPEIDKSYNENLILEALNL